MYIFIFILVAVSLFIGMIWLLSWNQQKLTGIQMKELNLDVADKISVQYTLSTFGLGSVVAAYPVRADMYSKEGCFVVTPKMKSFFSAMIVDNLPIVVTRNPESVRLFTKINNFINPDKLLITGMGTIRIEYKMGMVKRLINNKLLDKERINDVQKTRN